MKIHASYFILWALGYIYTSAEGTAARVDSWNTTSSWPQNCLGFRLNFSQVFCSCPCCCTLRERFYMKCTMGILPWSCEHLSQRLQTFEISSQNLGTVTCCDIATLSPFVSLATGAFGLPLLILSHHAKSSSKKIMPFSQGKTSTLLQVFLLCSSTSTIWSLHSNYILGYRLLF